MHDIETYTHEDKQRTNNPPVGMAQHDTAPETRKTYAFDPHLDPTLDWAGKKEGLSFDVPTSSIHIHESVKPHKIIRSVQTIGDDYEEQYYQMSLFETESPLERMRRRRDAIEFYQHGVNWTNRLIAGDSLVIMNSLIEKEGMSGQVQMIYIDPPYGIKYGSNFQPFVNNRDVKDKDDDLTQEPEMVKAFRDTWELGIHSYLTYLRNRLLLARALLADSGSIFVQISDENVHLVRNLCDDVFGIGNFINQISFRKTGGFSASYLDSTCDYIVWYCKDKSKLKYFQLYTNKVDAKSGISNYGMVRLPNGDEHALTADEKADPSILPVGAKLFGVHALTSTGATSEPQPFDFNGKIFLPKPNEHWKTTCPDGLQALEKANRLRDTGTRLGYVRFFDDFPIVGIDNMWTDTRGDMGITYVVQTTAKVIQRCMLMTTDPGELVLDITCGSGTTAYVAEQWGRRWITCDTSRVALTLAKKRIMTATFDYYKLAHEKMGVSGGFVYKTVPHVTLKSIANNEPPATETLYDQPEIDKTKVRISGPFTIEALPAPVGAVNAIPLDETAKVEEDYSAKQTDWREELLATGILGRGGNKIEFSRVEPLSGTTYLQAEAETKEDTPRRAVVCFAGETMPMDSRMVKLALDEAEELRPSPKLIVFAAFQFDPEAAKDIDDTKWPGVTLLKVQMNTDLMTDDLKKKRTSNQSFWLVGQPDVELIKIEKGADKGKYKVHVNGFDYYDAKHGKVVSGNANRIAMWSLDTNYDGMALEPMQVFFPMGGGWDKLAKTLKAEINQDLIEAYGGTESLPFAVKDSTVIAVKIIDDRGIESMKVLKIGGQS
jgi:adenine-specific DNA-methyltransferase